MKYLLPLLLAGCSTYPSPRVQTFSEVTEDTVLTTVKVCEGPRRCKEEVFEMVRNPYMSERRGKRP
jgi:hypothetical protein